jgi:hypothetical protein
MRVRSHFRWRAVVAVVAASVLAMLGLPAVAFAQGSTVLSVTAAPAKSAQGPTYADVSSTQGWQQTSVTLHRGDKVSLWYETGSWSVDHVNFPYVGPGGYSSAVDQKIYQGCKLNSHWVYGLMLGRVGNGATVVVGKAATLTADRDGSLQLRIHDGDACLGDNAGAIRMEYSVQAAAPKKHPGPTHTLAQTLQGLKAAGLSVACLSAIADAGTPTALLLGLQTAACQAAGFTIVNQVISDIENGNIKG